MPKIYAAAENPSTSEAICIAAASLQLISEYSRTTRYAPLPQSAAPRISGFDNASE